MSKTFAFDGLREFATTALETVGVPGQDAAVVADSLLTADSRGTYSHGLMRLPLYVDAILAGGIEAEPEFTWVVDRGSVALLDAGAALGQVAMQHAVAYVEQHVANHGVVAVAVQNSTHFGAGSYWTEALSRQGVLAFLTSSTGASVTPFGGAEKLLGTNPLSISVPSAGEGPLTLDIATSRIAYGKIVAAANAGRPIPEGMAVDASGDPTTDPHAALEGALLPFGEHKGSGLAVVLEALSVVLGTGSYARDAVDIWADPSSRMNTGHLLIAIDAGAFTGAAATADRVAVLQKRVRESNPGRGAVYSPGDVEAENARRNAHQVPLDESTVAALEELGAKLSVPMLAATGV